MGPPPLSDPGPTRLEFLSGLEKDAAHPEDWHSKWVRQRWSRWCTPNSGVGAMAILLCTAFSVRQRNRWITWGLYAQGRQVAIPKVGLPYMKNCA